MPWFSYTLYETVAHILLSVAAEELWALLHFANPTIFDDKDGFLEKFGQMTDAKQVNALHSLLKPYLLRRVKEDVEKSLPPKEETILEVSLTPIQKTFYKAIYERNTAFLYRGAKPNNAVRFPAILVTGMCLSIVLMLFASFLSTAFPHECHDGAPKVL